MSQTTYTYCIELWKLVGAAGIESLETTMNEVMSRGIPSSWRYSEISPIYKGKGSVLDVETIEASSKCHTR